MRARQASDGPGQVIEKDINARFRKGKARRRLGLLHGRAAGSSIVLESRAGRDETLQPPVSPRAIVPRHCDMCLCSEGPRATLM